jgi:hypothetical protein
MNPSGSALQETFRRNDSHSRLLKTRVIQALPHFRFIRRCHCLRLFALTIHRNSAGFVINPATGRSPMPVIAIIAIVVIVIILNKPGV